MEKRRHSSVLPWVARLVVVAGLVATSTAFITPPASQSARASTQLHAATTRQAPRGTVPSSNSKMMDQMRQVREEMEKDEKVKLLMQGLRGQNVNDDDAAAEGVNMLIVEMEEGEDSLPLTYQPEKLEAYFAKRPEAVQKRMLQIFQTSGGFMSQVALDAAMGKLEEREVLRAGQLRDVITSLGPFFIKLGQALSIRPDILSPRAMVELQKLCDKVPSFDNKLAMATIEKEVGPVNEVFSELSENPLAAASLGQVYKGKLRATGETVAVKVQRPFVLETVSLDLYLMRQLGMQMRKVPFLAARTDIVALLDEWAFRFYEELDYNLECQNGIKMAEHMKGIPQVVVPKAYPDYCSRRVHVAEWIEGEKLSQSTADDVQDLVNIGVVAYLTQLLQTGFFHADPHPGNLIRTPEGKLCLLDFGLMTEITDDQKYGMIEAISHLVHRDYARIGEDFKKLDFIPKDVDITPIVPALSKVFDSALAGGGAKSINFQELSSDLAEITFKYPFRIPPYFALIIRAIGVLEGIALVGNPSFAIVDASYPWLSKRLLMDDSPRLREALRYMIYGNSQTFDVDRLIDLLQAFETLEDIRSEGMDGPVSFGTTAMGITTRVDEPSNVRNALRFLFSPEGKLFRDFLLDETVKGVDAVSRDGLRSLAGVLGVKGLVPPILKAVVPRLNEDDKKVVENVQKLLAFLTDGSILSRAAGISGGINSPQPALALGFMNGPAGSGSRLPFPPLFNPLGFSAARQQVEVLRELRPVVNELGPQMRDFTQLIVLRLSERVASRLIRFTKDTLFGKEM